ncbi:serine hydrolase domain-containing protein [Paenibacillus vandeheii]|uniref:serine hydrolase domain-containing protein n=1 Tax=Paenibacillus vandeheii TaxID=3035917 RepID=UPI00343C73CB
MESKPVHYFIILDGSVVQIVWRGELVYNSAAGLADREKNRSMEQNALSRYFSVTKPIVSTAAMVLISRGKLKLDDLVSPGPCGDNRL